MHQPNQFSNYIRTILKIPNCNLITLLNLGNTLDLSFSSVVIVPNRMKPEIRRIKCGFVKHTGTRNAIFIIRIILERAKKKMQKYVHLCFRDYAKAFNKI